MATLPSGLSDIVADEEDLARFLIQSSQFNAFMAKPAAFLPNPANPGMSFHKLEKAKDKNFWSVRVGSDIRLIV